jgi:hypothetical protein
MRGHPKHPDAVIGFCMTKTIAEVPAQIGHVETNLSAAGQR